MSEHLDPHIADLLGLDLADPATRDGIADIDTLMDLITALVARREAAGLSHADVATAMETGVEEVADFERVGGDPTVAFAQRYARAVGASLEIELQPDDDEPIRSTRWFWWNAHSLTYRWRPLYWGSEENCNRTIGLRVPGGVLFLCLTVPLRQEECEECQALSQ